MENKDNWIIRLLRAIKERWKNRGQIAVLTEEIYKDVETISAKQDVELEELEVLAKKISALKDMISEETSKEQELISDAKTLLDDYVTADLQISPYDMHGRAMYVLWDAQRMLDEERRGEPMTFLRLSVSEDGLWTLEKDEAEHISMEDFENLSMASAAGSWDEFSCLSNEEKRDLITNLLISGTDMRARAEELSAEQALCMAKLEGAAKKKFAGILPEQQAVIANITLLTGKTFEGNTVAEADRFIRSNEDLYMTAVRKKEEEEQRSATSFKRALSFKDKLADNFAGRG